MRIALNKNGERVFAEDTNISEEYFCPICGNKLILKNGDINITHFSHYSGECEDKWNYDMSEWHKKCNQCFQSHNGKLL